LPKPVKNKMSGKKSPNFSSNENENLRKMKTLLDVSRQMAVFEVLDDMLRVLVEMTTKEVGADRGTLFLNDEMTGELYSRVALGNLKQEIRLLNNAGIVGHVFTHDERVIVHDAYADRHLDRTIDKQTGYWTKSVVCVPIKTVAGEIIGVIQILNKIKGRFTKKDMEIVEAMGTQAALALKNTQQIERMTRSHEKEMEFIDLVSEVTSEINLAALLKRVMSEATRFLHAERSILFLNDKRTNELRSEVGEGLNASEIRLPNNIGIAGTVFTTGKLINIPHAYADMRFNPAFDKQTGFFTRSILCVPVVNKVGEVIGVTLVLNKLGGPFTSEDESRLKAFTSQISIGLENAKLFMEKAAAEAQMDVHKEATAANQESVQFKKTINVLRLKMKELEIEKQEAVQKAIAKGNNEIIQLKNTIIALRDELQTQEAKHGKKIQDKAVASNKERGHLQDKTVALRGKMERVDAEARKK